MALVSRHQSSEVRQPCKETFHLPSPFVAAEWPTVLRRPASLRSIDVRRDHLDAALLQFFVEPIAVVSFVADQALGQLAYNLFDLVERFLHEPCFMRRSTVDPNSDRKTSAVCNGHDLGPFPALCFSHADPPFLAPAKEPSMKHSVTSIPPRSFKSRASSRKIASSVPSLDHTWNHRWQVWYGGYRGGRSIHGAPVLSTQRRPLIIARGSCRGRPRSPSRFQSAKNGSRSFHWSSVRSTGSIDQVLDPSSISSELCLNFQSLTRSRF